MPTGNKKRKRKEANNGYKTQVNGQEITVYTPAKRRIINAAARNHNPQGDQLQTPKGQLLSKRLFDPVDEIPVSNDELIKECQAIVKTFQDEINELGEQIKSGLITLDALEEKLIPASIQYQSHLVNYIDTACLQYDNLNKKVTDLIEKITAYKVSIDTQLEAYSDDAINWEEIVPTVKEDKELLIKIGLLLAKLLVDLNKLEAFEKKVVGEKIEMKLKNKPEQFLGLLAEQTRICLQNMMPANNQPQLLLGVN